MNNTVEPITGQKVRTNFGPLLKQLARREGKEKITTTYISRNLPAAYMQASKWRKDQLERVHLETVAKSINFFRSHGMNVSFEDMFTWVEK